MQFHMNCAFGKWSHQNLPRKSPNEAKLSNGMDDTDHSRAKSLVFRKIDLISFQMNITFYQLQCVGTNK